MCDSSQLHWPQHSRPPCPSPTPWVYSNSCPLSQWCHPTILSSVIPFSSCLLHFTASGSFPESWLFASHGQSIRASASVLPVNTQDWFPLGFIGLISLVFKGLPSLFQHHSWKASVLWPLAFLMVQLLNPYMTTGRTIALTKMDLCWQSNVSAF